MALEPKMTDKEIEKKLKFIWDATCDGDDYHEELFALIQHFDPDFTGEL